MWMEICQLERSIGKAYPLDWVNKAIFCVFLKAFPFSYENLLGFDTSTMRFSLTTETGQRASIKITRPLATDLLVVTSKKNPGMATGPIG